MLLSSQSETRKWGGTSTWTGPAQGQYRWGERRWVGRDSKETKSEGDEEKKERSERRDGERYLQRSGRGSSERDEIGLQRDREDTRTDQDRQMTSTERAAQRASTETDTHPEGPIRRQGWGGPSSLPRPSRGSVSHLVTEDLYLADSSVHQALGARATVIGVNLQVQGDTLHSLL